MTNIRRFFQPGHVCFLTHVTHKRAPILVDHADLLRDAMNSFIGDKLIAWVILPDHCHFLMNSGDDDVSTLIKRLKLSFSTSFRKRVGMRAGRVWQYRYWDRIIRGNILRSV